MSAVPRHWRSERDAGTRAGGAEIDSAPPVRSVQCVIQRRRSATSGTLVGVSIAARIHWRRSATSDTDAGALERGAAAVAASAAD